MDDPTPDQLRDARMIVLGAIAAAGEMRSSVAWRGRINALIPQVGAMMGGRSKQVQRALGMLNAVVFTAELAGFEIEQSSTRLVVKLVHDVDADHPDGLQRLRTERTDDPLGAAMAEKLGHAQPGNTLLCWKGFEEIRSGKNAGRQAAVLYHVEVLPDRKDSAPRNGGTPTQSAPEEGGSSGAPVAKPRVVTGDFKSPTDAGGGGGSVSSIPEIIAFNHATEGWDGKRVANFVAVLRHQGLWPPTPNTIDKILSEASVAP